MHLKSMAAAAAAFGLATAPVAAAPSSLSVANSARVSASADGEDLASGGGAIVALILVAGIIAIPVITALSDDDDPVSR
jgi:hypothetical protein